MSYKRLTQKSNNGHWGIDGKLVNQRQASDKVFAEAFDIIINRLAELEDKIERGELVENTVVTYVNMARTNNKTLIDKALKFDKLKAKIENGTLIELPCKVGDMAYAIANFKIQECFVSAICVGGDNEVYLELVENDGLLYQYPYNVWFTKAEAEAKLKERQNER